MRLVSLFFLVVLCLTTATLDAQRQLQLVATITDPGGRDFTTVTPDEVRVTEDGAPVKILKVELATLVPKVQILVDNGIGFPSEAIGEMRNGVRALLDTLPAGIEISLVTTSPQPRFLQAATTDRARVTAALDRLSPDSGAGRFVESLAEATQRAERDPAARYVIVSFATAAGDNNPRERDIQLIQERVMKVRPTVHVALLLTRGAGSGGVIQTDLGQAVTKMTSGRFEVINVPARVATLLPEWGAEIAKTLGGTTKQLRVTVERTNTGDLGRVSMGVAGKTIVDLALQ